MLTLFAITSEVLNQSSALGLVFCRECCNNENTKHRWHFVDVAAMKVTTSDLFSFLFFFKLDARLPALWLMSAHIAVELREKHLVSAVLFQPQLWGHHRMYSRWEHTASSRMRVRFPAITASFRLGQYAQDTMYSGLCGLTNHRGSRRIPRAPPRCDR